LNPLHLLPPARLAVALVTVGILVAAFAGLACGWLKLRRGVRTGFTRKIFHFAIFSAAMVLQVAGGMAWVNAYAVGVVAVILWGIWRGAGNVIFEGMARERDEPHRAFYVVVPLITTALGGIVSNLLAGQFALVGYLVTGWGDAVGEPAGVWLGRHPYRVSTLRRVPCTRTAEGSAAVGIAAFLAAVIALSLLAPQPWPALVWRAGVIAVLTVPLEALSPHGSDNFTTMVGASLAAMWLSGPA
jgi:phytol kinase